jgi:hypothetical protein
MKWRIVYRVVSPENKCIDSGYLDRYLVAHSIEDLTVEEEKCVDFNHNGSLIDALIEIEERGLRYSAHTLAFSTVDPEVDSETGIATRYTLYVRDARTVNAILFAIEKKLNILYVR